MLCPEATAGPVPGLRTSVVRLLGAVLFGTVSVGLSPKPPVTPTPTLVVAVPEDDEEDEEPEEPPQAARGGGAGRGGGRAGWRRPWRHRGVRTASRGTFDGEENGLAHGNGPTCACRSRAAEENPGMGPRIDLNADVAESFGRWRLGDDEGLLPLLTSANVACGFHAGDPRTIRAAVTRCAELGVVVGAQVSYRDLVGFG